jgi:hypothetical protein
MSGYRRRYRRRRPPCAAGYTGAWTSGHPGRDVPRNDFRPSPGIWQIAPVDGSADTRSGQLAQELVAADRPLLVLVLALLDELGDVVMLA